MLNNPFTRQNTNIFSNQSSTTNSSNVINPFLSSNTNTSSTTSSISPFFSSNTSTSNPPTNTLVNNPFVKATSLSSSTPSTSTFPFSSNQTMTSTTSTSGLTNNPFSSNTAANISFGINNQNTTNNGLSTNTNPFSSSSTTNVNNPFSLINKPSTTTGVSPFSTNQNQTSTNTNPFVGGNTSTSSSMTFNPFSTQNKPTTNPFTQNSSLNTTSTTASTNIFQTSNPFSNSLQNNNTTINQASSSPFSNLTNNTSTTNNIFSNNTTTNTNPFTSNGNGNTTTNIFSSTNNTNLFSTTNNSNTNNQNLQSNNQISFGFKPQTQNQPQQQTPSFGFVPSTTNQQQPQTQQQSNNLSTTVLASSNPFFSPQTQPQIPIGYQPVQQPNVIQYIPGQNIQQISYIQYVPTQVPSANIAFVPQPIEEIEKQFLYPVNTPSVSSLLNSIEQNDSVLNMNHRKDIKEYFNTKDLITRPRNTSYEYMVSQAPFGMRYKKRKSVLVTKSKNVITNRLADHSLTASSQKYQFRSNAKQESSYSQTQTITKRPSIFKAFSQIDTESEKSDTKEGYEIIINFEPMKITKIIPSKVIMNVKAIRKSIIDTLIDRRLKFTEEDIFLFMNGKNIKNSIENIDLSKVAYSLNKATGNREITIIAFCDSFKKEDIQEEDIEEEVPINHLQQKISFDTEEKKVNNDECHMIDDISSIHSKTIDTQDFHPKCTKFTTLPPIEALKSYNKEALEHLPNFKLRNIYAQITFLERIDLTYVDLDAITIESNGQISLNSSSNGSYNSNIDKIRVRATVELFESYIDESNEYLMETVKEFCLTTLKSKQFSYDKEELKLIVDVDLRNL